MSIALVSRHSLHRLPSDIEESSSAERLAAAIDTSCRTEIIGRVLPIGHWPCVCVSHPHDTSAGHRTVIQDAFLIVLPEKPWR